MHAEAITETNFSGLEFLKRGKVRDLYRLDDMFLIVSTDRISAFDFVLPTGIPLKGKVLNSLSLFWFQTLESASKNHLVTADVDAMGSKVKPYAEILRGRSMLVKRAKVVPVECVVRGYLAGSGWKEYKAKGTVCGIKLPDGMVESDRLPEPIFTPSTKAETGHDENISFDQAAEICGREIAEQLRDGSIALYKEAAVLAEKRGIIICDTKFEWGICDGELILVDEVLTPDSSRFWPMDQYRPGQPQPSFDKQYVRDWLEKESGWKKEPPAPALPPHVVEGTTKKYVEAYRMLTGAELPA